MVTYITDPRKLGTNLKVLSSEKDPVEIRLVKERGAEVFRKIHPSPIL
jgi:hypothetical protein